MKKRIILVLLTALAVMCQFVTSFASETETSAGTVTAAEAAPETEDAAQNVSGTSYKRFTKVEYGTPVMTNDGVIDPIWDNVYPLKINEFITDDTEGPYGEIRLLWDSRTLYVLAEVFNSEMDNSFFDPEKKDAVEIFLSEDYESPEDDEMDRCLVNFKRTSATSIEGTRIGRFFATATEFPEENRFIVQMKIPFRRDKGNTDETEIVGFDVQVNGTVDGVISSIAKWNYRQPGIPEDNCWGKLILKKSPDKFAASANSVLQAPGKPGGDFVRERITLVLINLFLLVVFCVIVFFAKKVKRA
ncbi:MAG: hypothetical protein LBS21_10400 [Clostridiales bacterium]|jgi:hypothetical protein|nr:hypothetical protein [Clostridiales bacterium]